MAAFRATFKPIRTVSSVINTISEAMNSNISYRCVHSSPITEAGHNRWSKIHRKKAVADMERSKLISKYRNQIISSIRSGGGPDPSSNIRLSSLISQAKDAGVSKANVDAFINQAISKQENGELVVYEGRNQAGFLLVIEVLTDNKKRTRPNLKIFLSKHGCTLGESGSSLFNFEHTGIIRVPCKEVHASNTDPMDLAIEVGAEDVIADNKTMDDSDSGDTRTTDSEPSSDDAECFQFKCGPRDLKSVSDAIKNRSFTITSASLEYIPKEYVSLNKKSYERALNLVRLLSEQDEVMEVYDNFILERKNDK